METPQENPVEGAIVTRYFNPINIQSVDNNELIHQVENYDEELENYDWSQDDEWYSAKDFLTMAKEGMIWPDCGGIVHIYVNDAPTNLHAGIWMLNKEDEMSKSVTLEELANEYDNAQLLWANK